MFNPKTSTFCPKYLVFALKQLFTLKQKFPIKRFRHKQQAFISNHQLFSSKTNFMPSISILKLKTYRFGFKTSKNQILGV
jgi:hypothetical protein